MGAPVRLVTKPSVRWWEGTVESVPSNAGRWTRMESGTDTTRDPIGESATLSGIEAAEDG